MANLSLRKATIALSAAWLTLANVQTASSPRAIFTIPSSVSIGASLISNIKDSQAKNAQDLCPGYKASDLKQSDKGLSATLTLADQACNVYGTDIKELALNVEYQASSRLAVKITPKHLDGTNETLWNVPENLVPKPKLDNSSGSPDLKFDWGNNPSFWFTVTRQSTGDVIFTTKGSKLVFENQFIEFVNALPVDYNLYGLGEHIHGLRLNNNFTTTIYAADAADPIDDNIYGSHPFYLETRYFENNGNKTKRALTHAEMNQRSLITFVGTGSPYISYSHGVYYRNTHGMEVVMKPDRYTWRSLGGAIDLYFFNGPSQVEVTKQYQASTIGYPALQQYWTFGYHQSRWGYRNWTDLRDVVDTMKAFDIPLETIWVDVDHMNQYRDFTLDPHSFTPSGVKDFFDFLHGNNQHFVPIVDSAIYIPNPQNASDAYDTYARGNASGVFMNNPDGSQYIGAVWPGYTVFPDWMSSNAISWWVKEIVEWYKEVPFSGLWADMSEASSFCVGSCGTGNVTLNPVHPPFGLPGDVGNVVYEYPEGFNATNSTEAASASAGAFRQHAATAIPIAVTTNFQRTMPIPEVRDINYPPYVINNVRGDLAVHAVSPNATHANGMQEYDVHNLFGHQIINATYQGLLSVFPGKRPFIIGRSTFAGSGKWAGHWGGDNFSKWAYMGFSIPQALSFSLYGIPMFGVDTCGFQGNTDMELCARWMQLSAFFPFYRNHNSLATIPQEPYRWESVATASRAAMKIRYALLPYMYTLFHQAHTTGSTVMRALAWEFPNEPQLAAVDTQFLLGPNILITPVLAPHATTVKGVFPGIIDGAVWYDWYNGKAVKAQAGVNTTIDAPLGHIPVYIRGGAVLPTQEPGYTTTESRKNPWSLVVALASDGSASGSLYVDDGESLSPSSSLDISFTVTSTSLKANVKGSYQDTNALANISIYGVSSAPGHVKLNHVEIDSSKVTYNSSSKILTFTGLTDATKNGAWQRSWMLIWA